MPTKCCLICDAVIQAARMLRYSRAILCGSSACALAHHRQQTQRHAQKTRYVATYELPADGAIDSGDPLFVPKQRLCGRCGSGFVTCAKWRYFCERCRYSTAVQKAEPDRTYGLSSGRRAGGA